ncbi:50S ribosomal protein L11 methyltransferase [Sediminicoccus sp. KRV36]|uniref:class I SAM-dependent methyltransferase n=1 Tax=Sediminicoccus sp. KRV36 TaxID=3133721 RepID=UPI0020106E5A|nr:50S ribosomal protein L11 methyltransferase [Sediminicoccus rosea]UPY34961.1 50S ribosomal protein L11 methyltransferase [Sediminicoccus rosea]
MTQAEAFIRAQTAIAEAPLLPGLRLHLATEITPIWQASEAFLQQHGMEPPFWAFAWPGGQALGRAIRDAPALVRGKRVLDFAAGCGIAAIIAAQCGASLVEASEIDPLAVAAIGMNAALNGVSVLASGADMVGSACRWDVILAGDVCYEAPMVAHILPWLRAMAAAGAEVLIADPGRAYLPREGMAALSTHAVPTSLELEDRMERLVTIARLLPF